jgi:hypothetical protein
LDGMMNGLLEDRQRTPLPVIGGRPHPSHSRTWFRPKLIFLILLSFCKQGNFKTNVIERDILTRCNFRYIGTAKKKKKGLRVLKKGLLTNRMGNNLINFLFPAPFDNWGSKGVIYFSPVKFVFLLPESALRGTIRCLVIFSMKTYVLPRPHNYIPVLML